MHWTLVVLVFLCGLCAGLNIVQLAVTRTVRVAGLLICFAWAVQERYWWEHGYDSLALFVACDVAVIAWFLAEYFLRRRTFDRAERLIAATIPFTTALGTFAHLNGGHTPTSWWANISIVAGQMVLGLPMPRRQTIGGSVSHGSVKHGGA